MRSWLILLVACATCFTARGVETTWLKMSVKFSFHDKDHECSTGSQGSGLYVGLDSDAGKVVAGRVASYSWDKPSGGRPFTAAELAALEVHQDNLGRLWLKAMALEETSLVWVINDIGNFLCAPKKPVVSVDGSPTRIYFDVQGLGDEYLVAFSNHLNVTGLRKDKMPYAMDFEIVQKRYVKESIR